MWPNPDFPADLVTLTEEIFNINLSFAFSAECVFISRVFCLPTFLNGKEIKG